MPSRFDRALPWVLVALMGAVMLMGLSWDASFEAAPANTDLASEGDDRIRELKVEVADRGEDELCWGTGATTGCPSSGDNGFAREGSARGFFATTAPTTLNDAASTALGTGHDGRFWVDNDGPDNVDANNDDNRVSFWNGSAFETFRWESIGGISLTSIANRDILKYDGTNLVNQPVAALITRATAFLADNETFTNGTCTADCTVTDVPDHSGGGDTNGYAEVTVPSSPSGVTWDIYVTLNLPYDMTSGNNGGIFTEIEYDIDDADTFPGTLSLLYQSGSNNTGDNRVFTAHDIFTGATAGSRYSFRVKMQDDSGTADWDVGSTNAVVATDARIVVEVRPRAIF